MAATARGRIIEHAPARTEARPDWRIAAIALLSTRFIQGFIYWGGGSRRFIYAPSKLDPSAPTWMANKFQTAMPGALFGTDHLISFMLTHFYLLYGGVILFSAAELIIGAMLMTGLLTRVAALVSIGLSVMLMAMFGWQGATCIDEWTMAACNIAMGATLLLAGSGAYSLDNVLLRRNPALAYKTWFRWASGSLPLPQTDGDFRTLAFALRAACASTSISMRARRRPRSMSSRLICWTAKCTPSRIGMQPSSPNCRNPTSRTTMPTTSSGRARSGSERRWGPPPP
jgi:uncharacterized membrane protein YphA (DoxX/SURF4 family)